MSDISLGEIVDVTKGRKPSSVFEDEQIGTRRLIQIEDLRSDRSMQFTDDATGVDVGREDICIAWDGANAGTVGYGLEGVIGSTIARLRPTTTSIHTPFLGRFLQSQFRLLNGRTYGATVPHVNRDRLLSLRFPRLSLSDQRRSTSILDKADGIRRSHRASLADADALLRSSFAHMVGGCAPGYEAWPLKTIEELVQQRPNALRTGPFGSDLRHSEFTDEGIVVLGIDNAVQNRFAWGERRFISPEKYEKLRRYRVFGGDVIVTIMGTTGRSAVVPDEIPVAISTKHLATISLDPEQADPYFVAYALQSDPSLRRQIAAANKGAIMDGLNLTIIRNLKLRRPPLALQQQFARLVHRHHFWLDQAQDPQVNGDALYASLAQRAFRGEL